MLNGVFDPSLQDGQTPDNFAIVWF